MKNWKLIKIITSIILIFSILYLIYDAISCMNMKYPHPMLGADAMTWIDQFMTDLWFFATIFGIPLIIDIVLLIKSIKNTKKQID